MCDIPFGSFICIYTGVIRKEDDAETNGRVIGDEYFANLNFIESGEATKAQWFFSYRKFESAFINITRLVLFEKVY